MVSPFSGLVLGSGAVLASPALWDAFVEGTLPVQTAIVRLLVAVLVSWVGLSLLEMLVSETGPSVTPDDVPRSLPGVDGPIPVRGAVIDSQVEPQDAQRG